MKSILAITVCCLFSVVTPGQVGIGTATPDASAALDVSSSSKGLLIPQMTQAQRLGINKPATGLLVQQTDAPAGFYYNMGTATEPSWLNLSAYTLQQNINTNGKWISHSGTDSGLFVAQQGLGIGNSTPDSRLTVQQAEPDSKLASFRTSQGLGAWDMSLVNDNLQFTEPAVPNISRLWLQKGGKVGIGTSTPFSNLGVSGNQFGDLVSFHLNNQPVWHLNLTNGTDLDFVETGVSTDRLRLKVGGNVGIGIADPYARLGIAANTAGDLLSFSGNNGPTLWHVKLTNADLNFAQTNGQDKLLYFRQGGRIGMATSQLFGRLTIKGDVDNNLLSFNNSNFDQTRWHITMTDGQHLNFAETGQADGRLFLESGGNVGIGTVVPDTRLHVEGDIKYTGTLHAGHIYQWRDEEVAANSWRSFTVGCPVGTRATGGGGGHRDVNAAVQDIVVNYSGPDLNNPNTQWRITVSNNDLIAARDVRVYVICAKIQ
jgi:hypothetical protein